MKIIRFVLVVGGFIFLTFTRTANAADLYGAISHSNATGKVGYSYNFGTQGEAEARAFLECGMPDCRVAVWFKNGCGALYQSVTRPYLFGWAWATTQAEAQASALRLCWLKATDCLSGYWACTDT